eukprot:12964392-Heterocapsa_arctica.AAC.1
MEVCPEALAILRGDNARDVFFMISNFVRLQSRLAYGVELVVLTCMKRAIDDVITELMKQKVDEIEIRCKDFSID